MDRKAVITQEHLDHLEAYGYQMVEAVKIGDYDLVLTYSKLMNAYHIAMQRDGMDFADITQQLEKYPEPIGARMSEAVPTLNRWIQKYKTLWISGNDPRKVRVYQKILARLGFKMESFNLFGTTLVSINSLAPVRTAKVRFNLI